MRRTLRKAYLLASLLQLLLLRCRGGHLGDGVAQDWSPDGIVRGWVGGGWDWDEVGGLVAGWVWRGTIGMGCVDVES